MQNIKSIVTNGWDRAGITHFVAIDAALRQEDPFMMVQTRVNFMMLNSSYF